MRVPRTPAPAQGARVTAVIATISLKGGVGKTTVTAGVAEFLAGEFGRSVLLVDLDSQINLTTMFLGDARWLALNSAGHTLATLFADAVDGTAEFSLENTCQRVSTVRGVGGIDLIPSSLDLIEATEEVSAMRVRTDDTLAGVSALRDALAPIANDYDIVLIDCPPNMGPITLNGLAMADAYIIRPSRMCCPPTVSRRCRPTSAVSATRSGVDSSNSVS